MLRQGNQFTCATFGELGYTSDRVLPWQQTPDPTAIGGVAQLILLL